MLKKRMVFFFFYLAQLYFEIQIYRSSSMKKYYILFKLQYVLNKRNIFAGALSLRKWRIK